MPIGNWFNHDYLSLRIYKHEKPYESRGSRTVLWEGMGEIPLPDPIIGKRKKTLQTDNENDKMVILKSIQN